MRNITIRSLLLLLLVNLFSACIAKKDIILPTRYDREMAQAQYRQCINHATNVNYTNTQPAEDIIKNSFLNCRGARQSMLHSYPRRWHDSWVKKIDEEIFQSELAWIEKRRN